MALPIMATDADRAANYDEAMPGWKQKPAIAPCPLGNFREWYIVGGPVDDSGAPVQNPQASSPTGTSYANQLYCRKWNDFINPCGFNCSACIAKMWPAIQYVQGVVSATLAANGADAAVTQLIGWIGVAGPFGITQADAQQIAAALNLQLD